MYNLAQGYWVYNDLIADLRRAGWVRFGPGFKAGVYGHPLSQFCIKLMGMGVGQDPLYFCERGYYLEHERTMLEDFRDQGFRFAPTVLDIEDSVKFLVNQCQVRPPQAELRVRRHDLLIMEYIPGLPLATQTGYGLNYDLTIDAFLGDVVEDMCAALNALALEMQRANTMLLLHNDPMPPNIIFSLNGRREIVARLVDFELAQNLRKGSPQYVDSTVAELYRERHVPLNPFTHVPTTNLDQHLIDGSISVARRVQQAVSRPCRDESILEAVSVGIPFFGGISLHLGKALRVLRRLTNG